MFENLEKKFRRSTRYSGRTNGGKCIAHISNPQ